MIFLILLLFASLLFLFYLLLGPMPRFDGAAGFIKKFGPSVFGGAIFFVLGTMIFGTLLAGLFWAALGWFLPPQVRVWLENSKKIKLQNLTKSFIISAAGLYSANLSTPEVVRSCSERFPEPIAYEFQNMLGMRNLNANATFPEMFRKLGQKYGLSEFDAVAAVVAAAEQSGGPPMAAKGLKRLGKALRERDRLRQERKKNNYESTIAAVVVLLLLGTGLIVDVTIGRHLFEEGAGKLVLALSSGLIVFMTIFTIKNTNSNDLA